MDTVWTPELVTIHAVRHDRANRQPTAERSCPGHARPIRRAVLGRVCHHHSRHLPEVRAPLSSVAQGRHTTIAVAQGAPHSQAHLHGARRTGVCQAHNRTAREKFSVSGSCPSLPPQTFNGFPV